MCFPNAMRVLHPFAGKVTKRVCIQPEQALSGPISGEQGHRIPIQTICHFAASKYAY